MCKSTTKSTTSGDWADFALALDDAFPSSIYAPNATFTPSVFQHKPYAAMKCAMSTTKKLTVLITGCSPGGMGAALAIAFHKAGHHVLATARNPDKLKSLSDLGITALTLDITSPDSIASTLTTLTTTLPQPPTLDILINNAATSYSMPITDASIPCARALFDTNVWSHISLTQSLLPLLLRSTFPAIIANHTSVGSITALPFQGIYNASKAALAMLTETMRLELAVFGVRVVDLKTAAVKTNIVVNNSWNSAGEEGRLPEESVFGVAREAVEKAMSQEELLTTGISPEQWAKEVMGDLLRSGGPPNVIWRGESASLARWGTALPGSWTEGMMKRLTKLDVVEEIVRKSRS